MRREIKRVSIISLLALLVLGGCFIPNSEALKYFKQGNEHADDGNYASAILAYDRAIEAEPEFKAAYNNRGLAKHELGHYAKAIADFRLAIQFAPDAAADTYFNRARSMHEIDRHEDALADLDKAIEIDSDEAAYYFLRAVAKRNLYQYGDAIIDLETALILARRDKDEGLIKMIEERLQALEFE